VPGRLAVDPPLAALDPLVDPHRVIVDQHGTVGPACPPRPATLGPTPSKTSRRDCSAPMARRCGARRAVAPPWPSVGLGVRSGLGDEIRSIRSWLAARPRRWPPGLPPMGAVARPSLSPSAPRPRSSRAATTKSLRAACRLETAAGRPGPGAVRTRARATES